MYLDPKYFPILSKLAGPQQLKDESTETLISLCDELRRYFLIAMNEHGGHFGASLGVVELTVALHTVFNTPKDKIIWDVGHQSHIHKMLTGRLDKIHTARQAGGLAPFTDRQESIYDPFGAGHASTALSAAIGLAYQADYQSIAVVGDGALTGGMSFEAMNHAGATNANVLMVYNDNGQSISDNVGSLAKFGRIQTFAESLNFKYMGVLDGHDLPTLVNALAQQKMQAGPRLLHIKTVKGKGYSPAEQAPVTFHTVPANYQSEQKAGQPNSQTYSDVFAEWACQKSSTDKKLQIVTPAMIQGAGLSKFAIECPQQLHDVGIAEQHAITFAAGLAAQGLKPVVSIYSTFLQRGYDQLIHDVCLQNLPVIFAIDRAGCVGNDGATHMGQFDLSFLSCVPNLEILAPSNAEELTSMLDYAYEQNRPIAIRFPKSIATPANPVRRPVNKAEITQFGEKIAICVFGNLVSTASQVATSLNATVINMRCIKPIDIQVLQDIKANYDLVVTLEENSVIGGAGSLLTQALLQLNYTGKISALGLPDSPIAHASRDSQLTKTGLDSANIIQQIKSIISKSC